MAGMESQEENRVVIDPVTQEPVEDPTLAQAIREDAHWITRRGRPITKVSWSKFMKKRRTYQGIPTYFGLTDREVQTYMKISREALVPISIIGRVWGRNHMKHIVEFLRMKHVPVYRWPSGKGKFGYHVFSGDIVRAVESCRIDMEADGGAWPKYMIRSDRIRKKRAKYAAERKAILGDRGEVPEDPDRPGPGGSTEGFDGRP